MQYRGERRVGWYIARSSEKRGGKVVLLETSGSLMPSRMPCEYDLRACRSGPNLLSLFPSLVVVNVLGFVV